MDAGANGTNASADGQVRTGITPVWISSKIYLRLPIALLPIAAISGCVSPHRGPAVTAATIIPADEALPDFWWNKPATEHIACNDFETLWNACKGELYARLFTVDREQYREGLLTSQPDVSAQLFEPWRPDTVGFQDQMESSLSTIRRTVHFEVTRLPDGSYDAAPKVLVERAASAEHRISNITEYRQAFTTQRTTTDVVDTTDQPIQTDYWYALRRDANLEKQIALSIKHRLGQ